MEVTQVGSETEGTAFSVVDSSVNQGKVLKGITFYRRDAAISSISVALTGDSTDQVFGFYPIGNNYNPGGGYQRYPFQEGERITQLSVWTTKKGNELGSITFSTSTGRQFVFNRYSNTDHIETKVNVHSGICMGVRGRHSNTIHRFGFVFLGKVTKVRLPRAITYTGLQGTTANITTSTLQKVQGARNDEDELLYWVITGSSELTSDTSWALAGTQQGLLAHLKITGNVDRPTIPQVVSSGSSGASSTFRWNTTTGPAVGASTTASPTSLTNKNTAWYHRSGTLAPGGTLNVRALIGQGRKPRIPFSTSLVISIRGRDSYHLPVSGSCSHSSSSDVQILVS